MKMTEDTSVLRYLTLEQKSSFDRDGFLVLPAISDEISQNIINWTNEVKSLPHKPGAWMHYDEVDATGQSVLSRTENFANFHKGFNELFRKSPITSILEELSGEPMVLYKEKINYKQPWAGGFSAHTDAVSYRHDSQASKHLSILMAVEPATPENGCLEESYFVVAGSHQMAIPIGDDNCIEPTWCKQQAWIPVPLKSGEFLIFGSYLAHRSGPNNSPNGRAAIYATYNALSDGGDKHEEYYINRRKLWPPTVDRVPGERYEQGARVYAYGTPMLTVDKDAYKDIQGYQTLKS